MSASSGDMNDLVSRLVMTWGQELSCIKTERYARWADQRSRWHGRRVPSVARRRSPPDTTQPRLVATPAIRDGVEAQSRPPWIDIKLLVPATRSPEAPTAPLALGPFDEARRCAQLRPHRPRVRYLTTRLRPAARRTHAEMFHVKREDGQRLAKHEKHACIGWRPDLPRFHTSAILGHEPPADQQAR